MKINLPSFKQTTGSATWQVLQICNRPNIYKRASINIDNMWKGASVQEIAE